MMQAIKEINTMRRRGISLNVACRCASSKFDIDYEELMSDYIEWSKQ